MKTSLNTPAAQAGPIATRWLGFFAFLLPLVAWAQSDDSSASIQQWLDRISHSAHNVSYEGTFVYRCDSQLVAMQVIHVANGGQQRDQLISLNGPELRIIQDQSRVTSILPEGVSRTHQAAGSLMPALKTGLEDHYDLILHGTDRAAGRQARVVEIRPRDKFRYGYRVWVDEDTGLVLRSDMVDGAQELIEQMMFTSIALLDGETAAARMEGMAASAPEVPPQATATPVSEGWAVRRLPSGFSLAEHVLRPATADRAAHEHMIFSDGLASVSVFIERLTSGDGKAFVGPSRMGAVNAFGSVVDGHQVTVVGDVPIETVKLIGRSVVPPGGVTAEAAAP